MVATGLSVAIPEGYEIQVRPRSGLAAKHGLTCLNTPGTIDSDYRGEIKVLLINLCQEAFTIQRGERIAQLVLAPVTRLSGITFLFSLYKIRAGTTSVGCSRFGTSPAQYCPSFHHLRPRHFGCGRFFVLVKEGYDTRPLR